MQLPHVGLVSSAICQLADRLHAVGTENVRLTTLPGRVLAETLLADRDSPPLDVSAMDGYAINLAEIVADEERAADSSAKVEWSIAGVAAAGFAPRSWLAGAAVQIFTGAPVPAGADCIIVREQTLEQPGRIQWHGSIHSLRAGQNIRYRGENARRGDPVISAGTVVTSAALAAIASVAGQELCIRKRVRVVILNTGDELIEPGCAVADWQIRDSNGPTLAAALSARPWVEVVERRRVADQLPVISSALSESLEHADAVLLTGGVSMGDTDHVPAAVAAVGGQIVFHRLPIRPGKPVLGAVTKEGKLILGLPGNPVSVAVTTQVIALPLLRRLAGIEPIFTNDPRVEICNSDHKTLDLTWYRLVQINADGDAALVESRGSGDLISLGRSIGFVTIPPAGYGPGPWSLSRWDA